MLKRLAEKLVRRICETVTANGWLPLREIKRGVPPNEEPYLDRYYLCGKKPAHFPERCRFCKRTIPATSASTGEVTHTFCSENSCHVAEPFPERLSFLPCTFLHHFRDSDQEEELHNHPWEKAVSFILAGGYAEERRVYADTDSGVTETRDVRPFMFNTIRSDDFHRVSLYERDAWSLFIAGPKAQSWGFWSKKTGEHVHWKQYRAWKSALEKRGVA